MYEQTTKAMVPPSQFVGADARLERAASVLGDATTNVSASVNRVRHLVGIVREFADMTLGSTLQAAPPSDPKKRPVGSRADSLRGEITDLHDAIGDLESEVARLHLI